MAGTSKEKACNLTINVKNKTVQYDFSYNYLVFILYDRCGQMKLGFSGLIVNFSQYVESLYDPRATEFVRVLRISFDDISPPRI